MHSTFPIRSIRQAKFTLFSALVAGATFSGCGSKTDKPLPSVQAMPADESDSRFAALLADLQSYMSKYDIPGASIAIVEHGKLAFRAGVGVKKSGEPDVVTAPTLFRVASLSKMVLAATAMKLVEEGKLNLSQPITNYVPYTLAAPFDPSTVSLDQLLTHTSGVPDFSVETQCPVGPGQASAWFAANGNDPLWSPPGAVWNYSNRGYSLLGWAIEQASGESYENAVSERVFVPSGMTTATYDPSTARASDHAVGHVMNGNDVTYEEPDAYDCAVTRPPAGVIASVLDYAHLVETLLASGGGMLTPTSVQTMETGRVDTDQYPGQEEKYGYGLFLSDAYKGEHVILHSGDDAGYRTAIWMVPDQGFAVVVFFNRKPEKSLDEIPEKALDLFLGLGNIPKASFTTPPSAWGEYVGTYIDPINLGTIDVALNGENLTVSATNFGVQNVTLTQAAGDRFSASLPGSSAEPITFFPGPRGAASWFVTRAGVGVRQ